MRGVVPYLVERRGGIHIPEDSQRAGPRILDHSLQQLAIEKAYAARLDDNVGVRRFREHPPQPFRGGGVDDGSSPLGWFDIPMLLPLEGIGFVEADLIAMRRQRLQNAAIIGRSAVPVGGQQAGSIEGDLHAASFS
jgi:hypothetical protein